MPAPQRRRWLHSTIGLVLSLALLFVSLTGLTWSQAGGARTYALEGSVFAAGSLVQWLLREVPAL